MLEVRGLSVAADGGGELLSDVSFSVGADESVGLVGESGSGKSLTSKAILGLLPSGVRVTGGEILLDGEDLLARSARESVALRGKTIGYVPQDPYGSLNPVLRIGEQIPEVVRLHAPRRSRLRDAGEIARGYRLTRIPRRDRGTARDLLASVRIDDPDRRIDQYPHGFSGGMRQRAVIASATALAPRLLIADEPTTALDASVEKAVLELIEERRQTSSASLLLVSHDLDVIAWMCTQVVVMYRGRVVEAGPTRQVFTAPQHEYTRLLTSASYALRHGGSR